MNQAQLRPDEQRMQLGEHLEELRRRLIKVVIVLLLFSMTAFIFHVELKIFAVSPLLKSLEIVGPEIVDTLGFMKEMILDNYAANPNRTHHNIVYLECYCRAYCCFSLFNWHLWGFVKPASQKREKGSAFLFIPSAVIFFYIGAISGFFYVLPWFYALLIEWGQRIQR